MRFARQFSLAAVAALSIGVGAGPGHRLCWCDRNSYRQGRAESLYALRIGRRDPGHEDAPADGSSVPAGPDGIFMVDAQYAQVSDKVLAAIRKISPEPIRFLVNTHVHPDHTAGDANFVKMGALLFAREELRDEMLRPVRNAAGNAAPTRDPAGTSRGHRRHGHTR